MVNEEHLEILKQGASGMETQRIPSKKERLTKAIDASWEICVQRIVSGRIKINKESSLQLHLGSIIKDFGELSCVNQGENFTIELETHYEGQNIDVFCTLDDIHAAVELKCFRKSSNRAKDTDMYDVLRDITRLESYQHAIIRRFICLTDNQYYPKAAHTGHAASVSIKDGKIYVKGKPVVPSWLGQWKDGSRDKELMFNQDITFRWNQIGNWFYLYMEV
jgi:hypothetical protein